MKTGEGTLHTWINPALFRALPISTRVASHLLWSAGNYSWLLPVIFIKDLCLHLSMYVISINLCQSCRGWPAAALFIFLYKPVPEQACGICMRGWKWTEQLWLHKLYYQLFSGRALFCNTGNYLKCSWQLFFSSCLLTDEHFVSTASLSVFRNTRFLGVSAMYCSHLPMLTTDALNPSDLLFPHHILLGLLTFVKLFICAP